MEVQKLCGKTELSGEISTPVRQVGSPRLVDLSRPRQMTFSDRYPAIPAGDRSLQTKSACRARKAFAPLRIPRVFATTVAFLFRSSSISRAKK
jgi:hypothetical protein